jgi:hypothetical protein
LTQVNAEWISLVLKLRMRSRRCFELIICGQEAERVRGLAIQMREIQRLMILNLQLIRERRLRTIGQN